MRKQPWIWTVWLSCVWLGGTLPAEDGAPAAEPSVLTRAMAGPLGQVEQIVFAVRLGYEDPHWYANIGYFCDDENKKAYPGSGQPDVGKLCLLDVRSRSVTVLFDAQGGSIRDPEVHYDARKVVFSYRQAGLDNYHLYEINLDGSGLRQLTSGPYDDYEPTYLPDDGIMFVSTRCQCWVNCWMTQVGVLYRCEADGSNIRRISHNAEHDNTPAVLPDGKILYTRWEYVDRSQVEFHHLWTINPDGSGEMVYYGNMHPGIVMIDARPIPNSRKRAGQLLAGPRSDRPPGPRGHRVARGRARTASRHRVSSRMRGRSSRTPIHCPKTVSSSRRRTRCWSWTARARRSSCTRSRSPAWSTSRDR